MTTNIDELDGMVKTKKCGYEFIGGCRELRKLKEENALLKEELLKKSETEQALQSTIEAIQDANKRINQCTEALRQINEIIKHYHLKVGGEVVGAEAIYNIENKVKEVLK